MLTEVYKFPCLILLEYRKSFLENTILNAHEEHNRVALGFRHLLDIKDLICRYAIRRRIVASIKMLPPTA
jgi:hypothetical protein